MGHHYVPQKYLIGFCNGERKIWTYDRQQRKYFVTVVQNVANENNFYSEEDEGLLNTLVETPANSVLDKIRSGQSATNDDWVAIGNYVATLLCRVPARRAEIERIAPYVFADIIDDVKLHLQKAGIDLGLPEEAIRARIEEVDQVSRKHSANPAELIRETIRCPWPSQVVQSLVQDMTWRLAISTASQEFVTSDNPVFYFECWGLGQPEAEISFPISSKMLIHGHRRGGRNGESVEVDRKCVMEMNRRTISKATRFIFHHRKEDWVSKLAHKMIDVRSLCRFV